MEFNYKNPLSVTSQFGFCGLPFRMDTYSGCAFGCSYCFARLRGGNINSKKIQAADPDVIINRFKNAISSNSKNQGVITEYISKRMPVHFGGMSDPFQSIEKNLNSSLKVLKYLSSINYPIVISTKSNLIITEPYIEVLKNYSNLVIQFSFSTLKDEITKVIEPNVPTPSELLKTIEVLSKNGIKTSIRWQPYIPGVSESPESFLATISNTGAKHVGFEHLKLPLEKNNRLNAQILALNGIDLKKYYLNNNGKRDGRELILFNERKLSLIKEVKAISNLKKMTFGAADNEFQFLSDTNCCCSGVDQFDGFENWNKFQIGHAVKKAFDAQIGQIKFELIEPEWKPQGAIDKHINSKSRLKKNNSKNTIEDYILNRWNNLNSPFNPTHFYGVTFDNNYDQNGHKIYNLDKRLLK